MTKIEELSKSQLLRLIAKQQEKLSSLQPSRDELDIAIIGMDCRFPGHSNDPNSFWSLLERGADGVSDDTSSRWDPAQYLGDAQESGKAYTLSAGLMDDIDQFDPLFFGISPREAETMDPQQRIVLEVSWRALENAGISAATLVGSKTGVFMGVGDNEYMQHCYASTASENIGHVVSSNALNVIAGRVAYTLGLQGPCMAIDTACSSSLVAVHVACQSLRNGESQLAIAGGVNVLVAGETFVSLSKANMLSPRGRCQTFSSAADGYVRAEGCGAVILKRLSDARRDGDRVLAVIKGSAVNQDGRSSSLTAPNGPAQIAVIRQALKAAEVGPEQVQYVETHGTGTGLGDPIEVQSLDAVYGAAHSAAQPLLLGALKSNIGHAESAAGIAALIKAVLCLQKRQIPANLHCETINPKINADFSRLAIPRSLSRWPETAHPMAAVSSFGFSGTNVHLIVAADTAAEQAPVELSGEMLPFVMSARSKSALKQLVEVYYRQLAGHELSLPAFAKTLALGRSHFDQRVALCAASAEELRRQLGELLQNDLSDSGGAYVSNGKPLGEAAFLFTGQGSQYPHMGAALYRHNASFRRSIDRCAEAMEPHLGQPLLELLWGEHSADLDNTRYTQPALFAVEYALAQLWIELGVEPDYMMGHSVGEYAAACVAGVFSLADACKLICARARLMSELQERGSMLAVLAPLEKVRPFFQAYADVSVAAFNGPSSIVLSGAEVSIRAIEQALGRQHITCQLLKVSHAFHSPLMQPMLESFRRVAAEISYAAPRYRVVSNLTGSVENERLQTPDYWVEHVSAPVNFHGGMQTLANAGVGVYLEVGPTATLLGMGRRCVNAEDALWLPSLRQGQCLEPFSHALACFYARGASLHWKAVFDKSLPMLPLPGHPLQKARYWLERSGKHSAPKGAPKPVGHPLLGTELSLPYSGDHLYMANWFTRSPAYFDHHRLYGQVVVPAASHVAMLLLAAEKSFPDQTVELQELLFPEALTLGDAEEAMIQLYIKHADDGRFGIQLKRIADDNAGHRLHAEGKLQPLSTPASSPDGTRAWQNYRDNYDRHFSGESFYASFWDLGYTLGSAFRWIAEGWQRGTTVLARMAVPDLPDGTDDYSLYPGLIDSCFQLIACCASGENTRLANGKIYIPFTIESFQYRAAGSNTQDLWCLASLREKPTENSNRVLGDIELYTDDGRLVARIQGFQARVTDENGLFQMLNKKPSGRKLFYGVEWQPVASEGMAAIAAGGNTPWLLVGSSTLSHAFAESGIAHQAIDITDIERMTDDVAALAQHLRERLALDGRSFAGVIYEASPNLAGGAALTQEIMTLSALAHAMQSGNTVLMHGFVYMAQQAATDAARVNAPASAMAALFKVLDNEGVKLRFQTVSLEAAPASGSEMIALLNRALGCKAEQVSLRDGLCHTPCLLPSAANEGQAASLARGWYAVTGGLGGIGLEVARHLVSTVAEGLILLGRGEPSATVQAFVAESAAAGISVRTARCDISDADSIKCWAEDLRNEGIALTGVVHAAGVVHDQALHALDRAAIASVLAPKVAGTEHLLHALAEHPLQHFIAFSSMSAWLGTQGQAAYAVANAYLNATLHNLRAERGIGLSLLWGPWAEVGMASRLQESVRSYYRARGIHAFDVAAGIDAFARAAAYPASALAAIDIDWPTYLSGDQGSPFLSRLTAPAASGQGALKMDHLDAEQRAAAVRDATATILARTLNCGREAFADEGVELTALGVDSLIAVDLRNKLQKSFGANVAIADMMASMTFAQLVRAVQVSLGELGEEEDEVAVVVRPQDRHQPFPITDMQQAYWIGRTGVFDLGGLSLHGYKEIESDNLDLERFGEAWRRLVNRHDMLRAYILPSGEQVVVPQPEPYRIAVRDLRGLPQEERDAALLAIREEMSHQVLPLDTWPAFDVRASLLEGNRIRLHLSVDGTYLDFRSFLILFRELILLYKDVDHPLPPLELTFRDYVLTQRAQEGTQAYRRSLEYWTRRIETIAPAPELPLAKKPSQVKNHRSKRWESSLPVAQWDAFKERMQQDGLTQAAVLLTVYGEVLATWSSGARFCINVPVFNRQGWHPDVNHVLGNFSSFTLVEFDYGTEMSFVARVKEVQRQLMEGLQHHHIGGVQIMRMINQQRGKISAGAYPCVYTSLPSGVDEWDSSLKSMITRELGEIQYTISQTPQVWIDVHVWYESGGLEFNWDAVEELFPEGMVDSMFDAYCRMIEALAADPALWMQSRIDLLPDAQRRLFERVNDTTRPIGEHLLQQMFYAAAHAYPQHTAVIAAGAELSYDELRRQANRLAHALRSRGIGRNDLVAVAIPKRAEQIVAVMGILIAGGAYLPIDINQPQSRIDYLLDNGAVRIVLTADAAQQQRSWPATVEAHDIGAMIEAAEAEDDLAPLQTQTDLAYVLYTSGSTGKPKGVMITHRNVVNMVEHTNGHFQVGPEDRAFNITALNHDLSVYDLFGCLAVGAAIVMPDEDKRREPRHWLALMQVHRVTLWNSVPALMDMLLESTDESEAGALPDLRVVILGGDWVAPALPGRIRRVAPHADMLSIGGPTETTVWNVWNFMNDAQPDWASIPYGTPISNSRYYILGPGGKPAPVWVAGELCCAGACVAQGYLNNPEATAHSFVAHPFSGEPIYKTGDLGRYLPDGRIEFLGRKDFQMKIRGQRIEAGEIEHAFLTFDGVEDAVVVDAGEGLQKQLVAHVAMAGAIRNMAQANKTADFLSKDEQRDVITNAIERLEFTLGERGLRRFDAGLGRTELAREADASSRGTRYLQRQSFRDFQGLATLESLERLLENLSIERMDGQVLPKYRYPSAGGLYPMQVYLYVKPEAVSGLDGGYYYYDPSASALVALSAPLGDEESLYAGYLKPLYAASAFSLFLVADLAAIQPMYGQVARDFCLLEAGYIGQLLMSESTRHLLGLCPVGGLQESDVFRRALQLSDTHQLVHSFTGGGIRAEQLSYWLEKPRTGAEAESASSSLTLEERLLEHLRNYLPEYMLPGRIVLHEKLPLTENGKVDRKALREKANALTAAREPEAYAAPASPMEQRLADILGEILNLPRVNVEGNFFEMGANSIHMVKIQKRFKDEIGRELAVTDLFRYPTLRSLVAFLQQDPNEKRNFSASRDRAAKRSAARGRSRTSDSVDVETV